MSLTLKEFQRQIKEELHGRFLRGIRSPLKNFGDARLSIYCDNVLAQRVAALQHTYPATRKIVGDNYFVQMAVAYARCVPSYAADLNQYGRSFADFVGGIVETREEALTLEYLPDLSRLEWCMAGAAAFGPQPKGDLRTLAHFTEGEFERMSFRLPSGASLFQGEFAVLPVWKDVLSGALDRAQEHMIVEARSEHLYIWNDAAVVTAAPIDAALYELLKDLQLGETLLSLCDKYENFLGGYPLDRILPELLELGWICE